MKTALKKNASLPAFLTGLIGFFLASAAGFLTTFLLFKTGLVRIVLNLVQEGQPLVRLLLGLFLVFVGVGLGGAVNGLLRGYTLHMIDRGGSRRRYLLGGAFAYGISQGVLLIPMLLLIALIGQYNPGSSKDPASFLILFSLLGGFYGLLSGLILGLVTLRLRYFWLPWLSSTVGTALGGALIGLVIWRRSVFLGQSTRLLQSIVFFLFLVLAVGLTGAILGPVYRWVEARRQRTPEQKLEPARWQDIAVILVGVVLFVAVISLTNTLLEFVTFHTGTTTTSLGSETEGVHWYAPAPVTSNIVEAGTHPPGLDAGEDGALAASWTVEQDGQRAVVYAYQRLETTGSLAWSNPVNVSNAPGIVSDHSQLALDSSGYAHIVWSAQSEGKRKIFYSRCQGETCTAPEGISGGACSTQPTTAADDWPAIAVSDQGQVLVAWNAGGMLGWRAWQAHEQPTSQSPGCLVPEAGADPTWQPRVAAGGEAFSLVYSRSEADSAAPVALIEIVNGVVGAPHVVGEGSLAEVFRDHANQVHLAWCDAAGLVTYAGSVGKSGQIVFPPCHSRPSLGQDSQKRLRLTWYSDQVQNYFNEQLPMMAIYESILLASGWSEPAIVALPTQPTWPAAANLPDGKLFLAWGDGLEGSPALLYSRQDPYQCTPDNLSDAARAVLEVVESGQFHPAGYQSPYCDNQYETFIYMPNPNPEFSSQEPSPNGGFDRLAKLVSEAQYEVLFSNMQWDPDQDGLSPGYRRRRPAL